MSDLEKAAGTSLAMSDWVGELVSAVGLPGKLSDLGETGEAYGEIAEKAKADHLTLTNPKKVDVEDYLKLLRGAL